MTLIKWVRFNTKWKQSTMINTEISHYITCTLKELRIMHDISEETHFPDWHIHTYLAGLVEVYSTDFNLLSSSYNVVFIHFLNRIPALHYKVC